jgi:hypothetical protein
MQYHITRGEILPFLTYNKGARLPPRLKSRGFRLVNMMTPNKNLLKISRLLIALIISAQAYADDTTTAPPVIFQNSSTVPPIPNPSSSLPGSPTSQPQGLPGLPSGAQNTLPGLPLTSTTPSLVQQVYPQPAVPQAKAAASTSTSSAGVPIKLAEIPYETITAPESYLPGIATIKDKKWMVSDFLYNLTSNIGVKVEIVKPENKYIPLTDKMLETRVADIFRKASILPTPLASHCEPPLPMFYVLIMVYPCEKQYVGFINAQLFEIAVPERINIGLNGVWQTVTWERQAMVASAPDDFVHELNETLSEIAQAFADKFKYYHPIEERPCYPEPLNAKTQELYHRFYP